MKKFLTSILFAFAFAAVPASAFTMDVQGGVVNHVSEIGKFNLNVFGHFWYPIDQMLFFGIGSGYQEIDNVSLIPVSGSVWVLSMHQCTCATPVYSHCRATPQLSNLRSGYR